MLLSEPQIIKDMVRCAALGIEVPGQHQEQLAQTLILCLFKCTCFLCSENCDEGAPLPSPGWSAPSFLKAKFNFLSYTLPSITYFLYLCAAMQASVYSHGNYQAVWVLPPSIHGLRMDVIQQGSMHFK